MRDAQWNLNLSIQEARRNEEIIALSDSQQMRFIDELNHLEGQEEKVKEIKRKIKAIRREPTSLENRKAIKRLYDDLDALQFKPDYMCLIIDRDKDLQRAKKGFSINNVRYGRLLGTTGGVKNETIVFASERLLPELRRRIDNGRNKNMPFVVPKLEAYRALTCSGSIPVSDPDGIIVVKDCITHFTDDVIMLDDTEPGEPDMETLYNYPCELDASDGFGMMTYELAQRWSEDLHIDGVIAGCCIRNAYCKGMVYNFPFDEFAKSETNQNMVRDAWGDLRDVSRAQLILTTSMLKLWDSYESLEDYLQNCKENGYTFSVTKACPLKLENERNLNYQFIQSYHLKDEDVRELIAPTVNEFKAVVGGSWKDALLFLRGSGMRAEKAYIGTLDDDYVKALMISPELMNDPYVQSRIKGLIRKKIDEAKTGVLKVHGNFQLLSGDPYALCQSMFDGPVTGLLKRGEVFSQYWAEQGTERVVCFRAPMTCHNNIRVMNVSSDAEAKHWYRYMSTVMILNCWDNTCAAMNGCDFDGDMALSTDNRVLLENTRPELPILCVQRKGIKKVPTEDDFVAANIAGFGDPIGGITNRITTMFDIQARFEKGSEEYETLEYRIKCGQLYQQNAINKNLVALPGDEQVTTW